MGISKRERSKSSTSTSTSPCTDLRVAYHICFHRWYAEKFVKGQWDKQECVSEWKKYRACLSEHLEDKHLSRYLDAEGSVAPMVYDDVTKSADSVSTGV